MFQKIKRILRLVFTLPTKLLPHRLVRHLSPRGRRILNTGLITFLLFGGGYLVWTLITPNSSDAAWWNDSWMYRQIVSITNSNGSDLAGFQVLVEVNTSTLITAGKLKSDCSDVRFTDENGDLLPYWIETGADACNTSSTNFWVKVPNVYTTGTNIFIYYGNKGAQAVQNGNMVFEFFDDFPGNAVDPSKWSSGTVATATGTNFTVSGGILAGGNNNRYLASTKTFTGNYTAEARTYTTTDNANGFTTMGFFATVSNDFGILDHNNTSYYRNDANWVNFSFDGTGQWSKSTTKLVGTDATYARVGETSGSSTATVTNSGLSAEYVRIGARYDDGNYDQNFVASWDWVTVRKAAATDPSASLGGEENAPSPVAYWAFDEGTGTIVNDSSSNQYRGTFSGSPTWTPASQCISGSCLYFDGVDDYIDVGSSSRYGADAASGSYTIEAWVKPIDVSRYNVLSRHIGGLSYFSVGTSSNPGWLRSMVRDTVHSVNYWPETSKSVVSANTWSHVVFIFNSGVGYKYYVNGKLINSVSNTDIHFYNTGSTGYIGIGTDASSYFKGYIDEFKLYYYERSAEQIKLDYNSRGGGGGSVLGATQDEPLSQGLVGYWKMDQSSWNGTAGEVIDSSGAGNNGTAVSGAEASTSAKFGNAGYFAGVDEAVEMPDSSSLQVANELTVCAWVYSSQTSMNGGVFDKTVSGSTNTSYLMFSEGTRYAWRVDRGGLNTIFTTSSLTNLQNKWSHLCGTYSSSAGGLLSLYVNGVQETTTSIGAGAIDTGSGVSRIGHLGSSVYPYNGNIDEVRVYNRALSPAEVSNLYNFAPGPVAYYPFEETDGASSVSDRSSNGLNLTIGGSPKFVIGKYGRAMKLAEASSTDRAYLQNSLYKLNNYTYGFWFRMDSPFDGTYRQVFSIYGDTDREPAVWRKNDGNCFHAMEHPGNQGFSCAGPNGSSTSFQVGTWYYYSQTKNGTSLNYYINGSLMGSTTVTNPMASSSNPTFSIGRNTGGYTAAGVTLDEFRLYNYARTPGQIVEDMNAGHPIGGSPVGSQVGYWKFDEGYGTTGGNSGNSGSTYNGNISGSEWTDNGKFSRALSFSGSNSFSVADGNGAFDFGTNDFTVSFWANHRDYTYPESLVSMRKGTAAYLDGYPGWEFGNGYSATGYIFSINDGTNKVTQNIPMKAGYRPDDLKNKWAYFAFVVSRATGKVSLYVNGVKQPSDLDISSVTGSVDNSVGLFLGNIHGWQIDGTVDEVKIYNSALTADQIKLDMNQGSSQVMGAFGLNPDGTASNSAAQTYCVPGDFSTTTCKPVGEWNFEQGYGSSVQDTSGNGNTGTWSGSGPKWGVGKVGKGGVFNGTNDSVSISDPATGIFDFGANQDFSISFWMKTTSSPGSTKPISKKNVDANDAGWGFYQSSGSVFLKIANGSSSIYEQSVSGINDGAWHQVTYTIDRSGNCSRYKDGVLIGTTSCSSWSSTDLSNSNNLYFGSNLGSNGYWNGTIDQIRIYDYVLSSSQVSWDYSKGKPVVYFDFDECQGGTVHEYYNTGNNGTITIGASGSQTTVGTCQNSNSAAAWWNGRTGKFNYSLNFDGTDDRVAIPTSLSFPHISVSAWIKTTNSAEQYIVERSNTSFYFATGVTAGASCFWLSSASANWLCSNVRIDDGNWHHVAGTYNGTTKDIYVDGKLTASTSGSGNISSGGSSEINIGVRKNGTYVNYFSGQIDDVQIFNYGLTDVQVRNIYNQSSAIRFGPQTGAP